MDFFVWKLRVSIIAVLLVPGIKESKDSFKVFSLGLDIETFGLGFETPGLP